MDLLELLDDEPESYEDYLNRDESEIKASIQRELTYKKPLGIDLALIRTLQRAMTRKNGCNAYKVVFETAEKYLKKLLIRYAEEGTEELEKELCDLLQGYLYGAPRVIDLSNMREYFGASSKPMAIDLGIKSPFSHETEVALIPGKLSKYGRKRYVCTDSGFIDLIEPDQVIANVVCLRLEKMIAKGDSRAQLMRRELEQEISEIYKDATAMNLPEEGYGEEEMKSFFASLGISITETARNATIWFKPNGIDLHKNRLVPLLKTPSDRKYLRFFTTREPERRAIGNLWMLVAREDLADQRMALYHRNVAETARVFEDKKHVPSKTQSAADESLLNRYFGKIEYDALVDLGLVKESEKEMIAVLKNVFHAEKAPDAALRIRLLGRHHATGIYWPAKKCLCIDLRDITSFTHEYFHLTDYYGGVLSRKYEFLPIREKYEKLLCGKYETLGSSAKERMDGSKYNLGYYLSPTEIFARCGEMYVYRTLGVRNAAVNKCEGFEYPDDKELMDLINEYYEEKMCNGFSSLKTA